MEQVNKLRIPGAKDDARSSPPRTRHRVVLHGISRTGRRALGENAGREPRGEDEDTGVGGGAEQHEGGDAMAAHGKSRHPKRKSVSTKGERVSRASVGACVWREETAHIRSPVSGMVKSRRRGSNKKTKKKRMQDGWPGLQQHLLLKKCTKRDARVKIMCLSVSLFICGGTHKFGNLKNLI